MKKVLTIAGSDSSGGAGIQADIKTMLANGVYAMSVVTSLTAQNTTGVAAIQNATPDFLRQELDMVFEDIFPDAVKIGMVSERSLIHVVAEALQKYGAMHVVLDPVMVATSGAHLMHEDAVQALEKELLPLAELITPNIPEAEVLSGMSIHSPEEMESAAWRIYETYGCAVLLKGGHAINDANDVLVADHVTTQTASFEEKIPLRHATKDNPSLAPGMVEGARAIWICGKRIDNPNTHGTGCTLSSAIASNLAKGFDVVSSVRRAKSYLSGAIAARLDLGKGSGPLDHGYAIQSVYAERDNR